MIQPHRMICHLCVDDPFLKKRIDETGAAKICDQCSTLNNCVPCVELMQWIHDAFAAHFVPGPGWDASETFVRMTGIDEQLAVEMVDDLSETYGHLAALAKDHNPYDAENYAEDEPDEDDSDDVWYNFQRTVKEDARFFNNKAEEWLQNIFEGLHSHRTWDEDEVIQTCGIGTAFFRARVAGDEETLLKILNDPVDQLGPPPAHLATAGRMNAVGISVFYGALEEETCRAEIRPPVGAHIVTGEFVTTRSLRLLDFKLLGDVAENISHFDPDYAAKKNRIRFLREFERQIMRPVMPSDEAIGYLPTQFVADFLAQRLRPGIDGIIFGSTQTGGEGRNVVLFNQASTVAPMDPDISIEVGTGSGNPREYDDTVWITLRRGKMNEPTKPKPYVPGPLRLDLRKAALRLSVESIKVTKILATRYNSGERAVQFIHTREALAAPSE